MTLKTFTIKLISSIQYLIYYELVILIAWLIELDTFKSIHIFSWSRPLVYLLILITVIKLVIAFKYKSHTTFLCNLESTFAHDKCKSQCNKCKAEEKIN